MQEFPKSIDILATGLCLLVFQSSCRSLRRKTGPSDWRHPCIRYRGDASPGGLTFSFFCVRQIYAYRGPSSINTMQTASSLAIATGCCDSKHCGLLRSRWKRSRWEQTGRYHCDWSTSTRLSSSMLVVLSRATCSEEPLRRFRHTVL